MRYVVMPRAWDSETTSWNERPTITVFAESNDPVPTGLLDQYGNAIGRVRDTVPIGFALAPTKS